MELVIASNNLHKVREFRQILAHFPSIDLFSLRDFNGYTPPEETGSTFEENAFIKAEHASSFLNKWVLADDSGLIVPALNDAPGVYSKRYAGAKASNAENRRKLLENMNSLSEEERSAYFECCIVLIGGDNFSKTVKGQCEGTIVHNERGSNGFGYDSLFVKNGYTKTFAELDEPTKNKVSHRRKAMDKLLIVLESTITK